MKSWKSQLVDGRVFELRSASKRYPTPCALVINSEAKWGERMLVGVDRHGVIGDGLYTRSHNPNIYIPGIRREQFNSSRVRRRRRELERFDRDDLALIRYGLALDFSGRIHGGRYSDYHVPLVVPAEWTVFWLEAYNPGDYRWMDVGRDGKLKALLHGAWHFESYGGPRHLGFKFGHAWATRYTDSRLKQIRQFFRSRLGGIIEQPVTVRRWSDGENTYTEEIRRECPALGSRSRSVDNCRGSWGVCG